MKTLIILTFICITQIAFSSNDDKIFVQQLTKNEIKWVNKTKINSQAVKKSISFLKVNYNKENLSKKYFAIADFSLNSQQERLEIYNIETGEVSIYKVAHGKGSDQNHDLIFDQFSSKPKSNSTPQGFHRMAETYYGKHGYSLRMDGLEPHNKTSRARAIVLHGADYVSWKHTGRSFGCPAVEKKYAKKIIDQLKGGALLYHFHESRKP